MISFMGAIFKYTGLVLSVLILSHIIQIKGVTISQYVDMGMNWVSGVNPSAPFERVTRGVTKQVEARNKMLERSLKDDAEVTKSDQKALNQVIETSANR